MNTNKVFPMELPGQNQVPTPPTVIIAEDTDLAKAMDELGLPQVVKIPDGSFWLLCVDAFSPISGIPEIGFI
jgi:glutathione synthase/RimK-type ligase-like ATP-grasp enzyme